MSYIEYYLIGMLFCIFRTLMAVDFAELDKQDIIPAIFLHLFWPLYALLYFAALFKLSFTVYIVEFVAILFAYVTKPIYWFFGDNSK